MLEAGIKTMVVLPFADIDAAILEYGEVSPSPAIVGGANPGECCLVGSLKECTVLLPPLLPAKF